MTSTPAQKARQQLALAAALAVLAIASVACSPGSDTATASTVSGARAAIDATPVSDGKEIFRHATFGNEPFWTDTLRLHETIQTKVDPTTALSVGLKVDSDVLPEGLLEGADLKSPATTVALLKLNAIVGVQATVDANNRITKVGITCALCHSTVDNGVMPGIGKRLDGWPNRDLNVGAIIALSPALTTVQRVVYNSWGPGMYDPRYNLDGKNTPVLIPPAYGLANVTNETYTADGPLSYWNAYVAVTQMHGQGSFEDARMGIKVVNSPDLVTPQLPALRAYQHSLEAPSPPAGSFDATAAARGRVIFDASCTTCHVGGSGTDNNAGVLHEPKETGMSAAYARRTATKLYRTTPLRALWQHPPYFHDGSAETLADVATHYNRVLKLRLTTAQQRDLVEYLKSL